LNQPLFMFKKDLLYLDDILESVHAILDYIEEMDFEAFTKDRKTYSATIREFEIIGEAVSNLSIEIKNQHTEIEWQDIKDFRNILIHEYFGVDLELVWGVIINDLPKLINTVKSIKTKIDRSGF